MATPIPAVEEDLEALFDKVAAESAARAAESGDAGVAAMAANEPAGEPVNAADVEAMYQRVGQLTRTLHEALRELGFDQKLAAAAHDLPDTRDRLGYIATLSGQAAEKVLSAVERAQSIQRELTAETATLAPRWDALYEGKLSVDEFKALAGDTRRLLGTMSARHEALGAELHAIMMAQDFHDLTGQVIKRVVDVAGRLERDLVKLLLDACPNAAPAHVPAALSGPAVKSSPDVVVGQHEVDDLLESLGF